MLQIVLQVPAIPVCESLFGSDPQTSVLVCQQGKDPGTRQMHAGRRRPQDKPDPIETVETVFRSDPQIAVPVLRDGECRGPQVTIVDLPRTMAVLVEVPIRRHCVRAWR